MNLEWHLQPDDRAPISGTTTLELERDWPCAEVADTYVSFEVEVSQDRWGRVIAQCEGVPVELTEGEEETAVEQIENEEWCDDDNDD